MEKKQKVNIASINVNSIRARINNIASWLKQSNDNGCQIDILLLQETKCVDEQFPSAVFEDMGYNLALNGEKSYNGVAIASKWRLEEIITKLPSNDYINNNITLQNLANPTLFAEEKKQQSRYIEAVININQKTLRVSSVYVPNGGSDSNIGGESSVNNWQQHDKFIAKINFLQSLKKHLANNLLFDNELQVIGGDFNITIDDRDVFDPEQLKESLCCSTLERQHFSSIINLGLFDSYRLINGSKQEFSWWDYRKQAFEKNYGLRLDYLLTNAKASNCLIDAKLIKWLRQQENPSDHCPCLVTLTI